MVVSDHLRYDTSTCDFIFIYWFIAFIVLQARIHAIQVDTGTYLHEPSGPPEQYADWLKSFDLEAKKGNISDLLISMVEVRSLYATLVSE